MAQCYHRPSAEGKGISFDHKEKQIFKIIFMKKILIRKQRSEINLTKPVDVQSSRDAAIRTAGTLPTLSATATVFSENAISDHDDLINMSSTTTNRE